MITHVDDDKHELYWPFVFVMKEMERSYNKPDLHRLVALNENDAHIEDTTINRDVVSPCYPLIEGMFRVRFKIVKCNLR